MPEIGRTRRRPRLILGLGDQARIYDRVAKDYHDRVISPFEEGVRFRLPIDVRRILRQWRRDGTFRRRVVIDFGCGIGEALDLVVGKVGFVAGIDFSAGMLRQSRKRLERQGFQIHRIDGGPGLRTLRRLIEKRQLSTRQQPTIALASGNLLKLGALSASCDLALAINAIGPPTVAAAYEMFASIAACARRGGALISVLPSLDTMYHLYALERRHRVSPSRVGTIDDATSIYIDGRERAKFFLPEEITQLCKDNHLAVERLEKIRYPWSLMRLSGWGYYPRSPRIWDWYVVARKK